MTMLFELLNYEFAWNRIEGFGECNPSIFEPSARTSIMRKCLVSYYCMLLHYLREVNEMDDSRNFEILMRIGPKSEMLPPRRLLLITRLHRSLSFQIFEPVFFFRVRSSIKNLLNKS